MYTARAAVKSGIITFLSYKDVFTSSQSYKCIALELNEIRCFTQRLQHVPRSMLIWPVVAGERQPLV